MEADTMLTFISGFLLSLALVIPIGVQNLFVLNQGLTVGFPRVLIAVVGAGVCNTLLIILGAVGVLSIITTLPVLRVALILIGIIFLIVMGIISLRASVKHIKVKHLTRPVEVLAQSAGVSLLNPHAILDIVGILGGAIASQPKGERLTFIAGTVVAEWAWFFILGTTTSILQTKLTPKTRLWIQRLSGLIMLLFAAILAKELL